MSKKGSIAYAFGKLKKIRPRKTGHSSGEKRKHYKDGFDYESKESENYKKYLRSQGI